MPYLQRVPRSPLNEFVESVWCCENDPRPHALERVLPNGTAQLIVNLKEDQTRVYRPELGYRCETSSGTTFSGVQSRYCLIDTAELECVAGVVFRPGGLGSFVRIPAHDARDAHIPLDLFWGRGAGDLREQLLEAPDVAARLDTLERVLLERCNPAGLHPAVSFALNALHRRPCDASVADVVDRIGLSPKRFIERFKAVVGVPPKQYCRILRFQRALARAEKGQRVNWTRIAVDCGYFDQAHFIHDFRAFAGITPTAYDAGRTQFRNHVKFLQSETDAA
jgi:AraC-like DNA-binding protein